MPTPRRNIRKQARSRRARPFETLDENLEAEVKISVRPLSWPINIGAKFKGYTIFTSIHWTSSPLIRQRLQNVWKSRT